MGASMPIRPKLASSSAPPRHEGSNASNGRSALPPAQGPRSPLPFQPAVARQRGEFIERQRKSWEEKLDQFARYVEDGDA